MADEFDIVDLVFTAAEKANTGLIGYKDNSSTGEKNNHYTVRTTGMETKDFVNKAPVVNVNIFIKKFDNGMTNRSAMRDAVRGIKRALGVKLKPASWGDIIADIDAEINESIIPIGMYFKAKVVWAEPLGEAKEGFDCTNIRLEVITELN